VTRVISKDLQELQNIKVTRYIHCF